MSNRVEYRVSWWRDGWTTPKRKLYRTRDGVDRFVGILSDPEPWRFVRAQRLDGDDPVCCNGYECGCRGATIRQEWMARREALPRLVRVVVESRAVGDWDGEVVAWEAAKVEAGGSDA